MYSSTTLDIRGHRGDAVPNTFFAQDSETHHLAVVFPGLGYTAHMPVLYYPRRLLLERGADVLLVEYDYRGTRTGTAGSSTTLRRRAGLAWDSGPTPGSALSASRSARWRWLIC